MLVVIMREFAVGWLPTSREADFFSRRKALTVAIAARSLPGREGTMD